MPSYHAAAGHIPSTVEWFSSAPHLLLTPMRWPLVVIGRNGLRRAQRSGFSRCPCEKCIQRLGKHMAKSPAFKNAPAGAVGWNPLLGCPSDKRRVLFGEKLGQYAQHTFLCRGTNPP